ncbi:MAG: type II toxin-antitoxin system YafQ family toxin [Candidatus Melainabacteria bacterium]|jgi:addiction module RelE/StbE family toxin
MEVSFSSSFKKVFKRKIESTNIEEVFWRKLELFISNPFDERLRTHKLSGKLKDLWSFSIEFDIRVIFSFTKDKPKKAILIDIGSHNEVY